jgi:small subunit ribosomal protein S16
MAVKLRLTRVGKTKQPQYRIVAADSRSPRDGRFIEILGQYNPRTEPSTVNVDNAKAVKWLSQGAQPTDRVKKLLEISGAWAESQAAKGPTRSTPTAPTRRRRPRRRRCSDTSCGRSSTTLTRSGWTSPRVATGSASRRASPPATSAG